MITYTGKRKFGGNMNIQLPRGIIRRYKQLNYKVVTKEFMPDQVAKATIWLETIRKSLHGEFANHG